MIPGELRNDNVKVANHIVPLCDEVEYLMNLNYADMIRQGNQDGRGYLSNRGLCQTK